MKYIIALVFAALVAVARAQSGDKLPLENVDVDNVLKNDKLVQRYIGCLLDTGRCDTNGKELKRNFMI